MNCKIDIDRFICSLIERQGVYRNNHAISELQIILGQQGLHYRNGEIVEIDKVQTIKFNKERLMEIAKPESIEEKYDIDIEKMVKEYRESLNSAFLPLGYYPSQLNEFTKVYKRGLEDMLKVIRKETNNET